MKQLVTSSCLVASLLLGFACQSIAGVEDVSFKPGAELCDEYCNLVLSACPGDLSVYEDLESCKKVCARLEPGNSSKPVGNTVQCRLQQAREAAALEVEEKSFHCPSAGPGGGERCAPLGAKPDCEGYCQVYSDACSSISKDWGFNSKEECVRKCAAVPQEAYAISSAATSGDTLACRLLHATRALSEPEDNCEAASLRPQKECFGDPDADIDCVDFCQVASVACTGSLKVFENTKQCLETCKRTPPGSRLDTSSADTRACRSYHVYSALLVNASVHCSHIAAGGDGVCSDAKDPNCKPYCRLAAEACPSEFADEFGDSTKCLEACRGLDGAMAMSGYSVDDAQSGDTLQCRSLHVARALAGDADACVGAFGGEPCN